MASALLALARRIAPGWPARGHRSQSRLPGQVNSETLLQSIFAEIPIGLSMLKETDLTIAAINPAFCKMLEYDEHDLIGHPIAKFVDERDRSVFVPIVTIDQQIAPVSKRYTTRQGNTVYARTRRIRLDSSASDERIILNITEDISRERLIEAALLRSQRLEAIGTLTGGISHDFNNLLGVLLGYSEALSETVADPSALEILADMIATIDRAADLTKRLLSFARRQSLKPIVVDLNEYLPTHIALLQRTLGEHIQISASLADDLWLVYVDPSQLADAILNLALNSRDAMPGGGVLEIATANKVFDDDFITPTAEIKAGAYVELTVTDTGTGMAQDVIPRTIEPFFSTKQPGSGTGLGLSMVYGFTRQSGGHLLIFSELGAGTTIRIVLPRSLGEQTARDDPRSAILRHGNGEVILVVDDNDEMRTVAMRNLLALGYRVKTATNGRSALAIIESDPAIDLLFTDIVMPGGMSGYDLAEKARQRRPSLPIVLSTGFSRLDDAKRAEEPLFDIIRKPYRRSELAEHLRAALQRK